MVDPLSKRAPVHNDRLTALARAVGRINSRVETLEATPSSSAWGGITGTLADQTDLQTALDGKQASGSYATSAHGHVIADVTGLQTALDGKQVAGDYQPLATVLTNTTAAFTTAQETKLSGVATGATANSSDATLLDRANHTGTQSISTVTGLQTALDGKQASGSYQPLATVLTNTTASFTSAQETKLAGIEEGAKVGDVVGPATSTDDAIARFDGATGELLQDSGVKITDNGSLVLPENSAPSAAGAGEMKLFTRQVANRLMPAFIGPSGLDSALQPLLGRNKIGFWNPSGNSSTVPGIFGFLAPKVSGFTATVRTIAATNAFTRMKRLGYQTAATAGTVGEWRLNANQFTVGSSSTNLGGFTYITRFGISDPAAVSGARMFRGMRVGATPTNVEPSTLTNCIGIGHGAADTNFKLFYGGSSAQTPIDLGADFPADTRNTDVYELALFSPPNSSDVHYEVTRLNTGHVATGSITNSGATVLPQNDNLMAIWGYRTNNATALAVAIDIMSEYIETDL